MKVGDRIIAISCTHDNVVEFFGRGIYIGDKIPEEDIDSPVCNTLREVGLANPCMKMDSGEEVYGCECWWGPESMVEERFKGYEFIQVSISDYRIAAKQG